MVPGVGSLGRASTHRFRFTLAPRLDRLNGGVITG